jgi:hypothetical protein
MKIKPDIDFVSVKFYLAELQNIMRLIISND